MLLAIQTQYLGPTNHRGPRIRATTSQGHKATIPYPHELNSLECHRLAADTLVQKYDWPHGKLVAGAIRNGYSWVSLKS